MSSMLAIECNFQIWHLPAPETWVLLALHGCVQIVTAACCIDGLTILCTRISAAASGEAVRSAIV